MASCLKLLSLERHDSGNIREMSLATAELIILARCFVGWQLQQYYRLCTNVHRENWVSSQSRRLPLLPTRPGTVVSSSEPWQNICDFQMDLTGFDNKHAHHVLLTNTWKCNKWDTVEGFTLHPWSCFCWGSSGFLRCPALSPPWLSPVYEMSIVILLPISIPWNLLIKR